MKGLLIAACFVLVATTCLCAMPAEDQQEFCSSDYDMAYCAKSCNRGDCTSSGKRDCEDGLMCCICPM